MRCRLRALAVAVALLCSVAFHAPVASAEPPAIPWWQEVPFRTLGLTFTALSPALLVVATPIAAIQGRSGLESAYQSIMACPARYTFVDPWARHPSCPAPDADG